MGIERTVSVEVGEKEQSIVPLRDKDRIKGQFHHEFTGDHQFLLSEPAGYDRGEKGDLPRLGKNKGALKAEAALRGELPEQFHPGLALKGVLQAPVSI